MKYLIFLAAVGFLSAAILPAEPQPNSLPDKQPFLDWSLLWSGSYEGNNSKPLSFMFINRGDIRVNFLPVGLELRGGILDRHTLDFELDSFWEDERSITNFTGGLYHKSTGSRILFGVLDEWGLSARIRNPWIRSPPYAENYKPLMADLKTAPSGTKEDEAYLYLSSPLLNIYPNLKLRGFASMQTELDDFEPAFSGGLEMGFANKTGLIFETFYTGLTLPPKEGGTWFSQPPALPERDFRLYAAGILFNSPLISVSSDFALSETFAWGMDIYTNFGICITPLLYKSARTTNQARPLSISFAMDGAGERFVYRDGENHGAGIRAAGKIEWKAKRNSLFRVNTVLRGPDLGEDFFRSSSGIYYRFPTANKDSLPVRFTRLSLTADRNAVNPLKINDKLSGNMGISIKFPQGLKNSSFGINFSGSVEGLAESDGDPFPYPIPENLNSAPYWTFNTANVSCELVWSSGNFKIPEISQFPMNLQLKSKLSYKANDKKDDIWDVSFNIAFRFKHGRISFRVESPDFPEKWNWNISWRVEKDQ
ncbi:MAG: hypothetical protein FWC03_05740 [Treponema sp.]|nr:hypothetical protein [Treponema sp.]